MKINRERFEAFLMSLPDDGEFNYTSNYDCLVCRFLKSTTRLLRVAVTPSKIETEEGSIPMPKWLDCLQPDDARIKKLLNTLVLKIRRAPNGDCIINIGSVKRRYLQLFPDTIIEPTVQSTPVHGERVEKWAIKILRR